MPKTQLATWLSVEKTNRLLHVITSSKFGRWKVGGVGVVGLAYTDSPSHIDLPLKESPSPPPPQIILPLGITQRSGCLNNNNNNNLIIIIIIIITIILYFFKALHQVALSSLQYNRELKHLTCMLNHIHTHTQSFTHTRKIMQIIGYKWMFLNVTVLLCGYYRL